MTNDLQSPPDPSVTALVQGIINDAQELFKQQLALTRREIHDDLRKVRNAAIPLGIGLGVAVVGSVMVFITLPLLLHWLWPALPLWAAFAIGGGFFAALGGIMSYAAIKKFQAFNPLPDQSFEVLKENVQWITNPK
jgi:hypothetical protein